MTTDRAQRHTAGVDRADGRTTALVSTSAVLAVGSAVMAVAHAGLEIPLLSALGPGGSRPVVPAAVAFSVATVLHAAVAIGVGAGRRWAWFVGVVAAVLTLLGAATPFRGIVSAVGIVLATVQLALLLTRQVRALLLDSDG